LAAISSKILEPLQVQLEYIKWHRNYMKCKEQFKLFIEY
jgi:hypothetical protein